MAKCIEVNVRQVLSFSDADACIPRFNGFRLRAPELLGTSNAESRSFRIIDGNWDAEENTFSLNPGEYGCVGMLDLTRQAYKLSYIKLGFDFHYNPVCFLAEAGYMSLKWSKPGKTPSRNKDFLKELRR